MTQLAPFARAKLATAIRRNLHAATPLILESAELADLMERGHEMMSYYFSRGMPGTKCADSRLVFDLGEVLDWLDDPTHNPPPKEKV